MDLSNDLLCLFNARVKRQAGSPVIEIPEQEIELGSVEEDSVYRVAIFQSNTEAKMEQEPPKHEDRGGPEPPVAEGDVVDVEIEDVGDQGDGIARVGPGYVLIVPGTELGERVAVEITDVRENMAFAEVTDRYDR